MDDLGRCRVACIEPVEAQPGPDRSQAAEGLPAGELVAAVHPLRFGDGHDDRRFVAALGVSGSKHLACGGFPEDPLARPVTVSPELRCHSHPVVVHVRPKRSGWSVTCEASGLARNVGEREAEPPELLGDGHSEVAGLAQVVEVLLEEAVLPVVPGCARSKRLEGSGGQDAGRYDGHMEQPS